MVMEDLVGEKISRRSMVMKKKKLFDIVNLEISWSARRLKKNM